jgi:hypothetical protein
MMREVPSGQEQPIPDQPAAVPDPEKHGPEPEQPAAAPRGRVAALIARVRSLIRAIETNDDDRIEEAILRLSRSRRIFAPLAFAIGAFALLFDGLRLLVSNWRLTLVQVIPAMWIWFAMYDLKAHVLHGKSFHGPHGPVLIPLCLAIVAVTLASFFLNAVFAMAISQQGSPQIRPAFTQARHHLTPILISGFVVGSMLAFATMISPHLGRGWFTISLGIVVGIMMVSYVALPARLIGLKPTQSPREKLTTSVVGGIIGTTVCTPPYLLGRLGLLMLGSKILLIPGIIVFAVGITLQAGATGAVRAIKMSTKLTLTGRARDAPAQSA